jgi:hypothetical protein
MIARKHYAASIILRTHIAHDQRDEARGTARDGVARPRRGL